MSLEDRSNEGLNSTIILEDFFYGECIEMTENMNMSPSATISMKGEDVTVETNSEKMINEAIMNNKNSQKRTC